MSQDQSIRNSKYFIIDKDSKGQFIDNRKQGSIWYQNGKLWTTKGGIQVQYINTKQKQNCKICNKWCYSKIDKKYYDAQNICQQCGLKLQTKMRIDGVWNDYMQKLYIENAISQINEKINQLQDVYNNTKSQMKMVGNQSGDEQIWYIPHQKIKENITIQLQQLQIKLDEYKTTRQSFKHVKDSMLLYNIETEELN